MNEKKMERKDRLRSIKEQRGVSTNEKDGAEGQMKKCNESERKGRRRAT